MAIQMIAQSATIKKSTGVVKMNRLRHMKRYFFLFLLVTGIVALGYGDSYRPLSQMRMATIKGGSCYQFCTDALPCTDFEFECYMKTYGNWAEGIAIPGAKYFGCRDDPNAPADCILQMPETCWRSRYQCTPYICTTCKEIPMKLPTLCFDD